MNNFTVLCELVSIGGVPVEQVVSKVNVYEGDNFKMRCWARDPFGRPVNLTGYTVTVAVGQETPAVTPINNVAGEFEFEVADAVLGIHDARFTFTHSGGADTRVVWKNALEARKSEIV